MPIRHGSNLVTNIVKSALSKPDVIEVKNRTLDGKWHKQTIGTGGTVVDIVAHFTMEEKLYFDDLTRTSAMIRVEFDQRYYIGTVDAGFSWYRDQSTNLGPIFTAQFVLSVESEGAM